MLKIKRPAPLLVVTFMLALYLLKSTGLLFQTPLYYINRTGSEPPGIYLTMPCSEIKQGDKVIMRPPEHMSAYIYGRGWLQPGQTMLKTVRGLPGDTYTITERGIHVNGEFLGPVYTADSQGLPLPQLRGTFTVQEGHVLPLALHPRSFDGRYFGEIPLADIVCKVVPLFIFSREEEGS